MLTLPAGPSFSFTPLTAHPTAWLHAPWRAGGGGGIKTHPKKLRPPSPCRWALPTPPFVLPGPPRAMFSPQGGSEEDPHGRPQPATHCPWRRRGRLCLSRCHRRSPSLSRRRDVRPGAGLLPAGMAAPAPPPSPPFPPPPLSSGARGTGAEPVQVPSAAGLRRRRLTVAPTRLPLEARKLWRSFILAGFF